MYFKNIFHKFGKISIFYETNIPCQDYCFFERFSKRVPLEFSLLPLRGHGRQEEAFLCTYPRLVFLVV